MRFFFLSILLAVTSSAWAQTGSGRISMDVQDIPVRVAVQLIAKEAGVNVATADSVSGTVTLNLRNVPWREALQAVVRSKGLLVREHGGVVWVEMPSTVVDTSVGLETALVPVKYHSAQTIVKGITDAKGVSSATGVSGDNAGAFLSARGRVFADDRSNTIVISDTHANVVALKDLIGRLDVPAKQVLIEARVVVASERFSRELGAKFGLNTADSRQALSGSLDGAMSNIKDASMLERTLMTGFALANPSGSAALSVLRSNAALDVELQAMQTQGLGQIISQPRIITTNQRPARIAQGREIGYVTLQNHSNANPTPNVAFKEALLELEVTPTITPDGQVFMQVQLKKDELDGFLQTSVGDIPQINKRAVTTSVLLRDGQTLVVGGVQEFLDQGDVNKVPFLGDIPGLGNLLRKTRKQRDKAELLIFLTPNVLPAVPSANLNTDNAAAGEV